MSSSLGMTSQILPMYCSELSLNVWVKASLEGRMLKVLLARLSSPEPVSWRAAMRILLMTRR